MKTTTMKTLVQWVIAIVLTPFLALYKRRPPKDPPA